MKRYSLKASGLMALLVFAIQLFLFQVSAQWSTDPAQNNAIATGPNRQNSSQIVSDGSGGAIITWWDYTESLNDYNIYAQRIGADGLIKWSAGGVAICTNAALQHTPKIVSDGNGGAIITWYDQRNLKNEIFAQKVNTDGVVQWIADGVSVGTVPEHFQHGTPAITGDGSGGAIIAWDDWRGDLNNPVRSMRAQKINSAGSIQWGDGGEALNVSSENGGDSPQIISDGNGGAIVSWNQWVGVYPAGNRDVFAQKINSAGTVAWGSNGVSLCSQTSEQKNTQLTGDGAGGAIIAWEDYRNGSKSNLYAQKLNSAGSIQWTANGVRVCSEVTNGQIYQKLLSDGSGGAFIVWQFTTGTVCVQRFNTDGIFQWIESGVTVCDFRDSQYPDIATDGGTGAIIAWNKSNGDIYAQRINSAGAVLWNSIGEYVSYADGNQLEPKITADGNGGAIMVWDDYRNNFTSLTDIYAQKIRGNGTLGMTTGISDGTISSTQRFTLNKNFPNPFVNGTDISFTITVPGNVSLEVFNLQGQVVKTLINGEMEPGSYTFRFEGTGLPAGIYYYRMKTGLEQVTRTMILSK